MSTRTYRLEQRAAGMADTRHKVLQAARQLFLKVGAAGFQRISIEALAEHAGVGRTTVFQQFGSRSGLLQALEHETCARAGFDKLLRELGGEDPLRALRAAITTGCQVWAAERPLFRGLLALAAIDPEVQALVASRDGLRRQRIDELAHRLQRQRRLRPGVTRRTAADLLWLLTGFQSFDTLYAERCSVRQVARLLLGQAAAFADLTDPRAAAADPSARSQRPQRPQRPQPVPRAPRRPARSKRPRR